ncbi:MAG: ATP synthase F1 subunit delta [Clostridia bacterium]|nr:ATP synthase F1 subunit delta [Clostridia bacterium]
MTDAKEYGKALFLITEEDGVTEQVLADVKTANSVFRANPDYIKLLNTPAISAGERVELVTKAFAGLDERLCNLIKILTEKRSVHLFAKAAEVYFDLYDESRGILRVEAVTAIPLTGAQSDAIAKKLSSSLGKRIIIKNTLDRSILGGVKLRYADVQLDGSVKTRLDKFEEALKNTVI